MQSINQTSSDKNDILCFGTYAYTTGAFSLSQYNQQQQMTM